MPMDPELHGQLRDEFFAHVRAKGVPERVLEKLPPIDFESEPDLLEVCSMYNTTIAKAICRDYEEDPDRYAEYDCDADEIDKQFKLSGGLVVLSKKLEGIRDKFRSASPPSSVQGSVTRSALLSAFHAPYFGNAHLRLHEYLLRCWKQHQTKQAYEFPYITIVQSSGFGKSRMILELARKCHQDQNNVMNVLYVCARAEESTGFPPVTKKLKDYFFPTVDERLTLDGAATELLGRLMAAYRYIAREGNWDAISEKLLKLFNGDVEDDEEFATTFQQESDTHVSTCEVETTNQQQTKKLLVLVIDEARSLLPREGDKGRFSWFRAMRRALSYANIRISTEFGDGAGIFAVLVDTNSKISNFVPSAPDDSSQRLGEVRLFPPFVLTESMDLCFHEGTVYRERR